MQQWCPNCAYFSKALGMNNCILVDWALHPQGERTDIMEWLRENTREDTSIFNTADGCPGFVPYPELAQKEVIRLKAELEEKDKEIALLSERFY